MSDIVTRAGRRPGLPSTRSPMSRKIRCPNCDGHLIARDGLTGGGVQCPLRHKTIVLKGEAEDSSDGSPDFMALLGQARPCAARRPPSCAGAELSGG